MSLKQIGCTSQCNKNRPKHIYTTFKVKRWNVDLDCIFDPLVEHSLELHEDIEMFMEPYQKKKKLNVSRLSVNCLLAKFQRREQVNLIHELLQPLDVYSSFFAVSAETGEAQMTDEELARHRYLEEVKREDNLDHMLCSIMDNVKDRAPLLYVFFEGWLYMLHETQKRFSKHPGVAESFYEEFFSKFLHLYGFQTRKSPIMGASRCCFQLDKRLRNLLKDKWPKIEDKKYDSTSQPNLFIIKNLVYNSKGQKILNPELIAVVEVKVPRKIGQWEIQREDICKMRKQDKDESCKRKDKDATKKDQEAVDTAADTKTENNSENKDGLHTKTEPVPVASSDEVIDDKVDLDDICEFCSIPSVVCHEPSSHAKQVMKQYVPQLLGEMICNFHKESAFKDKVFNSPYRLGVAVIGFKVQFVGMRFSKKDGKPGDDNRHLCPEKVILDSLLQTDLFFSKPLDILKESERKAIIDVLCGVEAISKVI